MINRISSSTRSDCRGKEEVDGIQVGRPRFRLGRLMVQTQRGLSYYNLCDYLNLTDSS